MKKRLDFDIREMISTTLYYVASKYRRKIITLDEVIEYTRILEKKWNIKFNLTYLKKFDCKKYEQYITPIVDSENVYFMLNPLCWSLIGSNIVRKEILLKEKHDELLNNKEYDKINTIYQNKINENKYINHPKKTISFESLFKLFMFECYRLGISSINKEQFWISISKIVDTLSYLNIHVNNVNKLKLFRIIYQSKNSQKYDFKNGNINLYLLDKKQYCIEIAREFNKETFDLISPIIRQNICNLKKEKVYAKRY